MLQSILDKFAQVNPMDGFAESALVKEFCVEARNQLVGAGASHPSIFGNEEFQRVLDLLDVNAPNYGIGTEMGRAINLYSKAAYMLLA